MWCRGGFILTTLSFFFKPWPEISSFFIKKSTQDTRFEHLCSGRHWAMTELIASATGLDSAFYGMPWIFTDHSQLWRHDSVAPDREGLSAHDLHSDRVYYTTWPEPTLHLSDGISSEILPQLGDQAGVFAECWSKLLGSWYQPSPSTTVHHNRWEFCRLGMTLTTDVEWEQWSTELVPMVDTYVENKAKGVSVK